MGNSSTSHLPSYASCMNLSNDSVTIEYWETASINPDFKMASIIMATILLFFLIIGLPSNLILIAFIISKRLKEPTYILLLNLAISDVLLCGLYLPFGIVSGYAGGFVLGNSDKMRCQVCQIGIILIGLTIASLNTLGAISIDRFLYIKYPLSYCRYVTATKTVIIVIIIWLFSAVQSVLPLFQVGEIRYTYSVGLCNVYLYGRTRITKNIYYMLLLVVLGLIPMITMIVTNAWIVIIVKVQIKKLYKTRKSFRSRNKLQNHERALRKEIKKAKNKKELTLLRAFGTILLANLITWIPVVLLSFVVLMIDADDIPIGIYMFVFLTFISHTVLHPIIEGCLIPELKNKFKKILYPCKNWDKATVKIDSVDDDKGRSAGCCCSYLDVCSLALLPESCDVMDINADTSFTSAGNQLDIVPDANTCE